jgi:hypothetical protein
MCKLLAGTDKLQMEIEIALNQNCQGLNDTQTRWDGRTKLYEAS